MDKKERLIIRLKEQIQIYKDSPNVNVTYIDLARMNEILLEILENKVIEGFNGSKN